MDGGASEVKYSGSLVLGSISATEPYEMTSKCGSSYIREDLYLGLLITRPTVEVRVAPRSNCRDRTAFSFVYCPSEATALHLIKRYNDD